MFKKILSEMGGTVAKNVNKTIYFTFFSLFISLCSLRLRIKWKYFSGRIKIILVSVFL